MHRRISANGWEKIMPVLSSQFLVLTQKYPVFENQWDSLIKKFAAHQSDTAKSLCSTGTQRYRSFCHSLRLLNHLE